MADLFPAQTHTQTQKIGAHHMHGAWKWEKYVINVRARRGNTIRYDTMDRVFGFFVRRGRGNGENNVLT